VSFEISSRRPSRRNNAPLILYRIGLGRLLGKGHIRLTHRGRKSGLPREVFLEVLTKSEDEWFVAAVWGPNSDWYQNLLVGPAIEIQAGAARFTPVHRFVPPSEGQPLLDRYRSRHPRRVRVRQGYIGRPLNAESTPVVAFTVPQQRD
jgi:deazaflavin-dependent oxidoreductase (nitroreductase family)